MKKLFLLFTIVAISIFLNLHQNSFSEQNEYLVLLEYNGEPFWAKRNDIDFKSIISKCDSRDTQNTTILRLLAKSQIKGPNEIEVAKGLTPLIPADTVIDDITVTNTHALVKLTISKEFLYKKLDPYLHDEILCAVVRWQDYTIGIELIELYVRAKGEKDYHSLEYYCAPKTPPIKKEGEDKKTDNKSPQAKISGQPAHTGHPQPSGALSGASIFLSPGHGWYWNGTAWVTQRSNSYNIVEDILNGEVVLQYLTEYLWNAGARVYTCRERDLNKNMVIVDNGGAGYSEIGNWTEETIASSYNGTQKKTSTVIESPTAKAIFTPNIPVSDYYCLYVWYRTSGSGTTTTDAHFTVNHTGGSTVWIQNENQDGQTWKYIGRYYFEKGSNTDKGSVIISNESATADNFVIADAVRFGGGMGLYAEGGSVSGKPRWEEAGKYHSGFMGKTYSDGRVDAMPLYAAWECEDWEIGSACYISWHNNAAGGTGTETYSAGTSGVTGSDQLRNFIHDEVINDVRAEWDATWTDRGKKTSAFTEISKAYNSDMPAALIEIGFFDRPTPDVPYLKEANFERICARAVYQGIVKFYNNFYTGYTNTKLLPEPPTNFQVFNNGSGGISLMWNEPPYNTGNNLYGDKAEKYKVYLSTNGKGFDNGRIVNERSVTLTEGFIAGNVYYFRVTALNGGGESFPTETLAVRYCPTGTAPILLVNGFSRLDRDMNVMENNVSRFYLWLMNTYDYVIYYAKALNNCNYDFDSCNNKAVIDGQINLAKYKVVIWMLGEESNIDKTLDVTEQAKLTAYLNSGGKLFISGSEIGYDLVANNAGSSFYNNYLHANYNANSSMSNSPKSVAGEIFNGLNLTFDNGTGAIYKVESPDSISAINGGIEILSFEGSSAPEIITNLDSVAGWWDPNSSGQTNADAASAISLDTSVKYEGAGSMKLYYVWGTGDHIREYNSNQPEFPFDSKFSLWVYGDNSNHQLRITIRDSDVELFANNYIAIDWTGWRKVEWDLKTDSGTRWYGSGDNKLTGPQVKFDSIEIHKAGIIDSGNLYFDLAEYQTGGGSGAAGIKYAGAYKTLYLTFPFETILDESVRFEVMKRSIDFLLSPINPNVLLLY